MTPISPEQVTAALLEACDRVQQRIDGFRRDIAHEMANLDTMQVSVDALRRRALLP